MRTLTFGFCLLIAFTVAAQNTIGLPEVTNYSKQAYAAGTQNWDIRQDSDGLLYFANNEGLLSFDGTFWHLFPLPNRTIVRALEIGKNGRIYVGGQNELGYFSPDAGGHLHYHSLLSLVPTNDRSFDDVWNICTVGDAVFFRSNRRIFQYSGNKVAVYKTDAEWRFMGAGKNEVIAQDLRRGLLRFSAGNWTPVQGTTALNPAETLVTSVLPVGGDSSMIATLKNGVFILTGRGLSAVHSPALSRIATKNIYKVAYVDKNRIAVATLFGGCHIIDPQGNLVQSLTDEEGLQNNTVRSLFSDRDNNIWLGLDNGIDFVAYNNAVKHIFPQAQNIGSGYASIFFNNRLYLGTSNGLYAVGLEKTDGLIYTRKLLQPVPGTEGQVWSLSEVNDKLLMGHHDGAFLINEARATRFDNSSGFWTFLPASGISPSSLMVAGNYKGLNFYNFANGTFGRQPLKASFESARFVVTENDHTVWVAHPYKGIFRVTVDGAKNVSVKPYGRQEGLLSPNNNYVYKIKNRVVAATENGIYEYNPAVDRFERSPFFQQIFGNLIIRYLKEDAFGNIWFIHEKELGVADFTGGTPTLIYFPELNNKLVSGFENLYQLDGKNFFIGAEKGFYHIDFEAYKEKKYTLRTQLRLARAFGVKDSALYGGYGRPAAAEIAYNSNSLHFEFSAILYGQQPNVRYSYRLDGFDNEWSAWSNRTEKDYTNLPAGNYVFEVKASSNLGNESEAYKYQFSVLPPWYASGPMKMLYLLLALGAAYGLLRWQQRRFLSQQKAYEDKQAQLKYFHQLELEKNERELIKLRNEKLEAELEFKNTELASNAMHLVQKGELLSKVKGELLKLNKEPEKQGTPEDFKKIIKILGKEDKMDAEWQQFAHHFNKVHHNFLVRLRKAYPALTPNDSKLCAYLRMNLSTKEIAQLMNISVRGVEISRYRLRKKLAISTSVNLFDFLTTIDEAADEKPN